MSVFRVFTLRDGENGAADGVDSAARVRISQMVSAAERLTSLSIGLAFADRGSANGGLTRLELWFYRPDYARGSSQSR